MQSLEIAQSTPSAASIARVVQAHYPLGEVVDSEFLRRGFNHVFRVTFAGGRRAIARLSTDRARGAPNLQFEAEALAHLAQNGCAVARSLPAANGDVAIQVALPEGPRALMLFDFVEGEATGESAEDARAVAQGLAAIHDAGASYRGAPSTHRLDLDSLLSRPLQWLLAASTMDDELRSAFTALADRVHQRVLAHGALGQVLCHGDAHSGNNFMKVAGTGERSAVFFDFEDAGPGYLAYELAVYPWSMCLRTPDGLPTDKVLGRWQPFIAAYRDKRPVAEQDLLAIPCFMIVRHIWLLGEYASRAQYWGSQALPTDYLRRQVAMLHQWETLTLPL